MMPLNKVNTLARTISISEREVDALTTLSNPLSLRADTFVSNASPESSAAVSVISRLMNAGGISYSASIFVSLPSSSGAHACIPERFTSIYSSLSVSVRRLAKSATRRRVMSPISIISPFSSAMGINSSGEIKPRSPVFFIRTSASADLNLPCSVL